MTVFDPRARAGILGKAKENLRKHPLYSGLVSAPPASGAGPDSPSPLQAQGAGGAKPNWAVPPSEGGGAPRGMPQQHMSGENFDDLPPQQGGFDLVKPRGTPDEMIDNMAADDAEKAFETSAKHVANMPDEDGNDLKKAEVNRMLRQQGADPVESVRQLADARLKRYQDMYDAGEITKERHTGLKDFWKNIFNVVPREDMGLVLMDFGLRAMMAGETMGDMGALGAAGSGALQGIQQRREADFERNLMLGQLAEEGARADYDLRRQAALDLREAPDTLTAEDGSVFRWEGDKLVPVMDPETGEQVKELSSLNRPYSFQAEMGALAENYQNWTSQDRMLYATSGVSPQQARQKAEYRFDSLFPTGADMYEQRRKPILIPGFEDMGPLNWEQAQRLRDQFIYNEVRSTGYSHAAAITVAPTADEAKYKGATKQGVLPTAMPPMYKDESGWRKAIEGGTPMSDAEWAEYKRTQEALAR